MAPSIEERIEKLLDRLDNPDIKERDVELIEKKIELLNSQR